MSKVFITGATGFLGYHVAKFLKEKGYSIVALIRENSDVKDLEKIGVKTVIGDILQPETYASYLTNISVVIHCAALHTHLSKKDYEYYELNVRATKMLIEISEKNKIQQFIYTSSIRTIGKNINNKISNEQTTYNIEKYDSAYGKTKYEGERITMNHKGLMKMKIINPGMIIGEMDTKPSPSGNLIKRFMQRKIYYYINTTLNIVDVNDVANAFYLIITKGREKQKYIVSSQSISLKDFFKLLNKISKLKQPLIPIPYFLALPISYLLLFLGKFTSKEPVVRPESVKIAKINIVCDGSQITRELGLKYTDINISIKKTIFWFKNFYFK